MRTLSEKENCIKTFENNLNCKWLKYLVSLLYKNLIAVAPKS